MIYINTFIENYYIIKYLVVNANILYNLPVEKEEKEKDEWTKKMKGAGKKDCCNCYGAWHGAYSISADTGESCGRVCRAVDKRRVSGKRQQGQYRCCEIQWWRYSAAYVS